VNFFTYIEESICYNFFFVYLILTCVKNFAASVTLNNIIVMKSKIVRFNTCSRVDVSSPDVVVLSTKCHIFGMICDIKWKSCSVFNVSASSSIRKRIPVIFTKTAIIISSVLKNMYRSACERPDEQVRLSKSQYRRHHHRVVRLHYQHVGTEHCLLVLQLRISHRSVSTWH